MTRRASSPGGVPGERARLAALLVLLGLCLLGGGGSHPDIASLLYLRPAAILCAILFLLLPGNVDFASVRFPLLLLALLALLMIVQLVPLPPSIWTNLPGHAQFAALAPLAGFEQPWRPLSVSPDLTLNALVSLSVPAALLIGLAGLHESRHRLLLTILLGGILASALLGVAQLPAGPNSPLYLYRVTNEGSPVGFFANRNHQAALLACALPLLALWAAAKGPRGQGAAWRLWLAALTGAALMALVVLTGSRAGLVLAGLGAAAAAIIFRMESRSGAAARAVPRYASALPWALGLGMIALAYLLSRAPAIERLRNVDVADDLRTQGLPTFAQMASDFFPLGSGFGTFDPVYRMYEPAALLGPRYLNHAHNDAIELVLTAGVPGALIALFFLLWWLRQATRAFVLDRSRPGAGLRRAAASVILILLVASLFDYPLRTPLMMAVFTLAAAWLAARSDRGFSPGTPRRESSDRGP